MRGNNMETDSRILLIPNGNRNSSVSMETAMETNGDFMAQVGRQLQRAATEAVKALEDITKDPDAGASARVSAARTILEMSARASEIEDIDARLEKLERAAAEKGAGGKLRVV